MKKLNRESILFLLVVLPVVLAFVYLTLFSVLPYNPLSYNETVSKKFQVLIPENWNFFTKNPRDAYTYILHKEGNSWKYFNNYPNANPRNFFGIIRKSRAQNLSMGMLISDIPATLWDSFPGSQNLLQEISRSSTSYRVKNKTKEKMLCGEICIVQQTPLPWAWRLTNSQEKMPGRFIKLLIDCE